jgi:hypothetical protein
MDPLASTAQVSSRWTVKPDPGNAPSATGVPALMTAIRCLAASDRDSEMQSAEHPVGASWGRATAGA